MKFNRTIKIPVALVSVTACAFLVLSSISPVSGLSGSSFKKDRIISDSKFYRTSSMSASSIQSFLNSKMPSCDTNGTKPHSSGGTRAQRGTAYGNPPPYICLKDYRVNTPSKAAASGLCNSLSAKSNRTAAQIIYDVSKACGIDSKVLIVMLQKEQGLVTDDWPWASQYRIAMGYGCPDDGSCNSAYYGFFNQVYNAARQLKNYRKNPGSFNYAVNRTSFVAYQANKPSCGGTNITMRNAATAGLYNYTPYQPNAAALNNLYGTGNSCSAYGNRNFWRFYSDWFGTTRGVRNISRSLYVSPVEGIAGKDKAASFVLKNNEDQAITISSMTVAVRDSRNRNFNFPHVHNITIQPGETYTYHERRPFNATGNFKAWIAVKHSGSGDWHKTWPASSSNSVIRQRSFNVQMPDVRITRHLYESPANISVNDTKAASFKIKNYESVPITIPSMTVAVRDSGNRNRNFPHVHNITIQPGETYTYYERRTFSSSGNYKAWIAVKTPSGGWSKVWPSSSNSIIRQRSFHIN